MDLIYFKVKKAYFYFQFQNYFFTKVFTNTFVFIENLYLIINHQGFLFPIKILNHIYLKYHLCN